MMWPRSAGRTAVRLSVAVPALPAIGPSPATCTEMVSPAPIGRESRVSSRRYGLLPSNELPSGNTPLTSTMSSASDER